jgi:hypothetical protein
MLVKKAGYKLLTKVRAALILLLSSWYMKPSDFRPGVESKYKNLGWGMPLIPGFVYAWSAQVFYGLSIEYGIEHAIPHSNDYFATHFLEFFWGGNYVIIPAIIYFGALVSFVFHSLFCGLGRIFRIQESPPPYEFFLVRTTGGFMWFSIAFGLMALPILALKPNLIGRLAAGALAVPLICAVWAVLFLVAGLSYMGVIGAENRGRVGLKEMYESERFVKLVWRTQVTLFVLTLAGLIFLARHPDFLPNFILSHH